MPNDAYLSFAMMFWLQYWFRAGQWPRSPRSQAYGWSSHITVTEEIALPSLTIQFGFSAWALRCTGIQLLSAGLGLQVHAFCRTVRMCS